MDSKIYEEGGLATDGLDPLVLMLKMLEMMYLLNYRLVSM